MNAKKLEYIALSVVTLTCCLTPAAPDWLITSILGSCSAILALQFPWMYLPLLLVTSMSMSFAMFGVLSAFMFYGLFMLAALLVGSRFRMTFHFSWMTMLLILFLGWMVVCCLVSNPGALYACLKLVFVVALLVAGISTGQLSFERSFQTILFIIPFCAFAWLFKYLLAPDAYVVEGVYNEYTRLTLSKDLNPNQLAPVVSCFSVLLFATVMKKGDAMQWIGLVLCLALLYFLKCRTAFYSTLGVCGLFFLFGIKGEWGRKICILAIALVIGLIALSSNETIRDNSVDEKSMDIESVIEDDGSGRFLTWAAAFTDIIPSHPIFGIGLGRESYQNVGFEFDADNMYVDMLCELGIPGLLLFLAFFVLFTVKVTRTGRTPAMALVPCLFLVYGLGETLFDATTLWTAIFLGLLYVRTEANTSKNES